MDILKKEQLMDLAIVVFVGLGLMVWNVAMLYILVKLVKFIWFEL